MSANIWFWLIYVITLVFGVWGMNPWRPSEQTWAPFGSWLILFVLMRATKQHLKRIRGRVQILRRSSRSERCGLQAVGVEPTA